jgi:hypothetical protein
MNVILKEGFNYIPKWNDNRKAKKDDQFSIDFTFLSGSTMSDILLTNDDNERKKLEWTTMCTGVNGLTINGEPITALDIFEKPGLSALYLELKLAIRNESEIDKKKL